MRKQILVLSLLFLVVFASGCKGRKKNRCATCPTWSYLPMHFEINNEKG